MRATAHRQQIAISIAAVLLDSDLMALVLERLGAEAAAAGEGAPHAAPMRNRRVCRAWRAAGNAWRWPKNA